MRDVGSGGGDRVVVARLDAHDARRLAGTEADGKHGSERDRHLAEDVSRLAAPDDALDSVDRLDGLDATLDQPEEGALRALLRRELAGARAISAAARASCARSSSLSSAKIAIRLTSSGVITRRKLARAGRLQL